MAFARPYALFITLPANADNPSPSTRVDAHEEPLAYAVEQMSQWLADNKMDRTFEAVLSPFSPYLKIDLNTEQVASIKESMEAGKMPFIQRMQPNPRLTLYAPQRQAPAGNDKITLFVNEADAAKMPQALQAAQDQVQSWLNANELTAEIQNRGHSLVLQVAQPHQLHRVEKAFADGELPLLSNIERVQPVRPARGL